MDVLSCAYWFLSSLLRDCNDRGFLVGVVCKNVFAADDPEAEGRKEE